MINFKNTPIIREFKIDSPDRNERVEIVKKIKKDKKQNRKIAKPLYKDIPSYNKYYKILKYNEKHQNDGKLLKKEPLKFVKINTKTNTIYKKDSENIKYKLQFNNNKIILTIIHKSGNQKQIITHEFKKRNNKYKIKYDIKVFILSYIRNHADDL